MTIEAQLYPSDAGFPFSASQPLVLDIHHPSFNSQHHQHPCSFKHQQQGMQQQLHNQRHMSSSSLYTNPSDKYGNGIQLMNPNSPHLPPVEFDEQRDEVDHYIKSQNEKLRILLHEQRKQQMAELLDKVGSDAVRVLSQKDEQIAQAAKRRAELEEFLTKLETENQTWKRVAQENEAMVLSLHNTLEQIKERAYYGMMMMEVAESCCDENRENMAMDEKGIEERGLLCGGEIGEAEEITKRTMVCKSCNSRNACFMFLPCRHLCSCKICEAFLQACPVCKMPKKSSIETLIF